MPKIVAELGRMGRRVEVHAFSREESEEGIRTWLEDNRPSLVGKELIVDGTISRANREHSASTSSSGTDIVGGSWEYVSGEGQYLDSLMEDATMRAVLGIDAGSLRNRDMALEASSEEGVRQLKESISCLMRAVLEKDKSRFPTEMYIVSRDIGQHAPLSSLLFEMEKSGVADPEGSIAQNLKQWFVEAGIPEDRIIVIQDFEGSSLADMDVSGAWVVVDRHNQAESKGLSFRHAIELNMPFGNLFHGLYDRGLIDVDPGKVQDQLDLILRRDFKGTLEDRRRAMLTTQRANRAARTAEETARLRAELTLNLEKLRAEGKLS